MAKKPLYNTPRDKMDVAQVSKLMLDIITTDDPVEKKRLLEFNQPSKRKPSKKNVKQKSRN